MTIDEIVKDWLKRQDTRIIFKAKNPPQSLKDAFMLAHGVVPNAKMLSWSLKRCGFTRYNASDRPRSGNRYSWLSPPSKSREDLLRVFTGLKCPSCGTISQMNRPDGYRFRCVDCGYTETAEQSLARLRTPEQ